MVSLPVFTYKHKTMEHDSETASMRKFYLGYNVTNMNKKHCDHDNYYSKIEDKSLIKT